LASSDHPTSSLALPGHYGRSRAAVSNRLVAFNPCEDIRVPPRRRHDFGARIITREELRTVLLPVVPDRYRAIVATAGAAGLRWREAAGLCADAADLDQRRLRVIRTVVEVSGQTSFKPFPKSAAVGALLRFRRGWLRPFGSIARITVGGERFDVLQRGRQTAASHTVSVPCLAACSGTSWNAGTSLATAVCELAVMTSPERSW
jgi:integrase